MFVEHEQKIIDRLRARLPREWTVEPLREIERVPELRQKAPAAWVIYDGFELGDSIATGQVQQVVLSWFVVVAAKSAKGRGETEEARDLAGAGVETVLKALLGYHLGGGKHLRLSPAPGAEYDAGYAFIPLAFTSAMTFKGEP